MMALVEDESLPHGPLELLMTVAEEVGLEGANASTRRSCTGSILVNLDSEEDGRLTVGCAGSTDTWIRIEAPRARRRTATRSTLAVTVSGGSGGHSGMESRSGRSNAVKVLGRALREALGDGAVPARLARGRQEPQRDPARRDRGLLRRCRERAAFRDAVGRRGRRRSAMRSRRPTPGVSIDVAAGDASGDPWTRRGDGHAARRGRARADRAARAEPGLRRPRGDETSLGEACTEGDQLTLHSLSRSSNDSALPEVIATLDAVGPARRRRARGQG